MEIIIIDKPITKEEVQILAEHWYGSMIKGCVDVELGRVALGGDYHIESSELLTQSGSHFDNVWGFNVRFEENPNGILEFDSMVNIKPHKDNKKRSIQDADTVNKATAIILSYMSFLQ